MVEIPTYQIEIFVFDVTFLIEKNCAKARTPLSEVIITFPKLTFEK